MSKSGRYCKCLGRILTLAKSEINEFLSIFWTSWFFSNPKNDKVAFQNPRTSVPSRGSDIKRLDTLEKEHNGDGEELVNKQLGRISIPY